MSTPCPPPIQQPARLRPNWYPTGTVTVYDPDYEAVALTPCPLPLHCWKSQPLPDGSMWMWLGAPWYRAQYTALSGMLFFAPSWERWSVCQFNELIPWSWECSWTGQAGQGRIAGIDVTVDAPPPNWS